MPAMCKWSIDHGIELGNFFAACGLIYATYRLVAATRTLAASTDAVEAATRKGVEEEAYRTLFARVEEYALTTYLVPLPDGKKAFPIGNRPAFVCFFREKKVWAYCGHGLFRITQIVWPGGGQGLESCKEYPLSAGLNDLTELLIRPPGEHDFASQSFPAVYGVEDGKSFEQQGQKNLNVHYTP